MNFILTRILELSERLISPCNIRSENEEQRKKETYLHYKYNKGLYRTLSVNMI